MTHYLESVALTLVADGKGILAANETAPALTKHFDLLGIPSTEDSRRIYREMLFTARMAKFIGGVIMNGETIGQKTPEGIPLAQILLRQGILTGLRVDNGGKPLAGAPGEMVAEGLDGLRERLFEYRKVNLWFATWRAVFRISDILPSHACVSANAHVLARFAALCQEQELVPIVEPHVLMDGTHSIECCEQVTGTVLQAVFEALYNQGVRLEGMLLSPNMVISGNLRRKQASVQEVAATTLRCLRQHVPAAVPGILFSSGSQDSLAATAHLNAINKLQGRKPWKLSFCYGRALQDHALEAWHGRNENLAAGREALHRRALCNSAASLGKYTDEMEGETDALTRPHRCHWRDE